MKRSTFSEEQIVYAIRQAESGTPIGDLCQQLGVSDVTFSPRSPRRRPSSKRGGPTIISDAHTSLGHLRPIEFVMPRQAEQLAEKVVYL